MVNEVVVKVEELRAEQMAVVIDYTNYRGERGEREIWPSSITFSYTTYHTELQWLLTAFDIAKGEMRVFAMKDIHSWRPANNQPPHPG